MARYFFDIYDDKEPQIDTDGVEFASLEAVRKEAQRLLPDVARSEIPEDGDRRSFVVVVRDETHHSIYAATLTYTGLWFVA